MVLTMQKMPDWAGHSSHTNICVWDAAAAHLQYEDALRCNPRETSGQAFLVTGKSRAWRMKDNLEAVKVWILTFHPVFLTMLYQVIANKPLALIWLEPLIIFPLCHFVEAFLFLRYYFLLPFYLIFSSKRPRPNPLWMGELVYIRRW
jgi:hypothetical protein